MKTIICDRCGESVKLFNSVCLKLSSNKLWIRGNFDLCMECYNAFKEFMEENEDKEAEEY